MKKIKILLAGLSICALSLTSCDNEEVLPPIVGTPPMLETNMDDFTVEDVSNPNEVIVWTWSDQYGAVASAYTGGSRYKTDVYLISPELQIGDEPTCTFSQAINYLYSNPRADFINVCIREAGGEWVTLDVVDWPAGSSWTFNDCSADVSAFANKTVQIGFHYQSTSTVAPTWEIKNLRVY